MVQSQVTQFGFHWRTKKIRTYRKALMAGTSHIRGRTVSRFLASTYLHKISFERRRQSLSSSGRLQHAGQVKQRLSASRVVRGLIFVGQSEMPALFQVQVDHGLSQRAAVPSHDAYRGVWQHEKSLTNERREVTVTQRINRPRLGGYRQPQPPSEALSYKALLLFQTTQSTTCLSA